LRRLNKKKTIEMLFSSPIFNFFNDGLGGIYFQAATGVELPSF